MSFSALQCSSELNSHPKKKKFSWHKFCHCQGDNPENTSLGKSPYCFSAILVWDVSPEGRAGHHADKDHLGAKTASVRQWHAASQRKGTLKWACSITLLVTGMNQAYSFPGGASGREPACQGRRHGFNPWVGTIPWRRKWQPIPMLLPGHGHALSWTGQLGLQSIGWQRVEHDWSDLASKQSAISLRCKH